MTDLSCTQAEKYRPDCKANHIATWSKRRGGGGRKREKGVRKREREERKTNINRVEGEIKATQTVRENRGRKSITPAYGWCRG